MYCVTHNIIEQARLEQMVDVFQAVKSVRMQRPGCVPTEVSAFLPFACFSFFVYISVIESVCN